MNHPSPRSILGADRNREYVGSVASPAGALRQAPDFLEYWRRLMARKWLLLGVMIATIIVGVLIMQSMTRLYRATAIVLIEDGRNDIVQIRDFYSGTTGNRDHFTTQSEFIESRNVAERVIKQLGLAENPEFDPRQAAPGIVSSTYGWVRNLLPGAGTESALSERDLNNSIVSAFSSRLEVEPLRATQLVKVHFLSKDPERAAGIANAVAEAYITADLDARYAVTQHAHAWLSEQVGALQSNLAASELALQSHRDSKGLIDKASTAQGGTVRQLETITQQLVEARVRRARAEQQYKQIQGRSTEVNESAPPVLADPSVQRARGSLAEVERRMTDAVQRYGPLHPEYRAIEADLETARASLRGAVEAVTRSIAKEYESARAVEKSLEKELDSSRERVREQNRDELELAVYEQEVATNRQLYETFLARLKETNIARDIQTPIARIIDRAIPPSAPSKPAKVPMLLAFVAAGLILGIAVVLIRARLDDALSSIDDAENALGIPVIAALPRVSGADAKYVNRMFIKRPASGFSEAIRTARTAIRLATMGSEGSNVIIVTSSLPTEGKSTVALNVALAQAQVSRTLMVECDIRRPTLVKRLGLPEGTPGITDYLKTDSPLEECTSKVRGSSLECMVAGGHLDAPLELLMSDDFSDLIGELRLQYDMIIMDTPPLALVSDAVRLAELSDGIVLAIKAHTTPKRLVQRLLRNLKRVDTPLIGAVMTQLDVKRARKYYGEYGVYDAGSYGAYDQRDDSV